MKLFGLSILHYHVKLICGTNGFLKHVQFLLSGFLWILQIATVKVSFVLLVKQGFHSIKTEDLEGQLETGQVEAGIVFVLVSLYRQCLVKRHQSYHRLPCTHLSLNLFLTESDVT